MTKKPNSLKRKQQQQQQQRNNESPSRQLSFILTSKQEQQLKELNLSSSLNKNKRFRRTISFINTNRKRASQFCTLKHTIKNRRLSLGHPKKIATLQQTATTTSSHTPRLDTLRRFRNMKQRMQQQLTLDSLEQLKNETIFLNVDQRIKDYIRNQATNKLSCYQNEELNNKIDLEIRILDGILKLLNAICSANPSSYSQASSSSNASNLNSINNSLGSTLSVASSAASSAAASLASSTLSTFSNVSVAWQMINNLDITSQDDPDRCSLVGAEIAAAIMSNKTPNEQASQTSATALSSTNSTSTPSQSESDFTNIYQILSACKCLYVSHRKISIYLHNLQELEKKSGKKKHLSSNDLLKMIDDEPPMNTDDENAAPKSAQANKQKTSKVISNSKPLTKLNFNNNNNMTTHSSKQADAPVKLNTNNDVKFSIQTTKIMLKDIRIPLSWKYSDHLKAIKNSENINQKFATFAIIYLGNMIYDTQLLSNVDPTVTEICFNETFIFDDVKQNDFLVTIELYSYELFNTANNLMQSARKLAKQLTDFATFKRNTNQSQLQTAQTNGGHSGQSVAPLMSGNNYSYSMHKFKMIAKGCLTQKDLSDHLETRSLDIINEPTKIKNDLDVGKGTINSSNIGLIMGNSNKLPLFDYYSCCLCLCPTSTYI